MKAAFLALAIMITAVHAHAEIVTYAESLKDVADSSKILNCDINISGLNALQGPNGFSYFVYGAAFSNGVLEVIAPFSRKVIFVKQGRCTINQLNTQMLPSIH